MMLHDLIGELWNVYYAIDNIVYPNPTVTSEDLIEVKRLMDDLGTIINCIGVLESAESTARDILRGVFK